MILALDSELCKTVKFDAWPFLLIINAITKLQKVRVQSPWRKNTTNSTYIDINLNIFILRKLKKYRIQRNKSDNFLTVTTKKLLKLWL